MTGPRICLRTLSLQLLNNSRQRACQPLLSRGIDRQPGQVALALAGGRERASTYGNLVLDPGELLLSLCQLCIGLLQGLPLGGHIAVDLVEADYVDAPGAQARGGRGLGADELGVECRVALVGPGEGTGTGVGPTGLDAGLLPPDHREGSRGVVDFSFFPFFFIF